MASADTGLGEAATCDTSRKNGSRSTRRLNIVDCSSEEWREGTSCSMRIEDGAGMAIYYTSFLIKRRRAI